MLRLLLSNCNGTKSYYRQILQQPVNTARINISGNVRLKTTHKLQCPMKGGSAKESIRAPKWSILLGGCGVSLSIVSHSYLTGRHRANCEASNRLAGVIQQTLQTEETKFDWRRFWSYLKPHIWELIGAIAAALLVAYINIRIPSVLGELINTLARYANTYVKDPEHNSFLQDVRKPATNLLSLYCLQSAFTFIYIYMLSRIGEQMTAKLRQDLFRQIIIQDITFFDRNRTGELVNRLTADVQDFKTCFKQFFSQGLRSAAQLLGGSISLFLISPHMAIIALSSVPAVVAFMTYLGKKLRNLSKNAQAQSERATAVCEEALANIRTVRSSACEYREMELFEAETNAAASMAQELGFGIAVFQGLTNFFLNGMVLATLFTGGHLMSTESLSPGSLMAFLVAAQGVQRSLAQGSVLLGTMIRGMTAGSRVFEYLQIEPKVELLRGYKIPTDFLKGEIRFENVSFAYPTRPDQMVLKEFSLVLRPGQTVALVGGSGSGKSTIAALLERFYEPSEGCIKIDGYKLPDISPHWLRCKILGFIEQQPVLFATTILENIRYGRPEAEDLDVHQAAKLSQSHEFVSALPDGYATNVGERGTQLSGGQRQRIAIARALLKNPKVLILDEATSALDATSEAEVQKALDTAVLNRTTLVIAHRLSTIRHADLIVVLDHGRIVESGKHDELMAQRGYYYALVRQQEPEFLPIENEERKSKSNVENEQLSANSENSDYWASAHSEMTGSIKHPTPGYWRKSTPSIEPTDKEGTPKSENLSYWKSAQNAMAGSMKYLTPGYWRKSTPSIEPTDKEGTPKSENLSYWKSAQNAMAGSVKYLTPGYWRKSTPSIEPTDKEGTPKSENLSYWKSAQNAMAGSMKYLTAGYWRKSTPSIEPTDNEGTPKSENLSYWKSAQTPMAGSMKYLTPGYWQKSTPSIEPTDNEGTPKSENLSYWKSAQTAMAGSMKYLNPGYWRTTTSSNESTEKETGIWAKTWHYFSGKK